MELTLWYLSGVWNLEMALLDFWKNVVGPSHSPYSVCIKRNTEFNAI